MRRLLIYLACSLLQLSLHAQKDYTRLVNPFIGTGRNGHTYPGASMPFGMMQLSPDTRMANWDGSSGYHYSDSVIYGFSHTHLSGTGIPDYCDVLLMPYTGAVQWNNLDYRSPFSHQNEKASPGYYEVLLDKGKIKAQLTTSYRSGMHQYTFPATTKEGAVLIELAHRDEVLESWIEKVSDYELRGLRRSKSWAQNQYVYFSIRFERPIRKFAILNDSGAVVNDRKAVGKKLKASVQFDLDASTVVRVKVGLSGVSTEGAKLNLDREIPHWDFDAVRTAAQTAWNKELSKIAVEGGTKDQQAVFYTALYHTFLVPNIYQDVDGQYRGTDLNIHKAEGFTNYTVFSLWDTYRAYHPLMTILNQKRTTDWINTFLKQYQYGGMLPVWELSGNETFCMIGYHSVPVITDAYQKGIRGFDDHLALQAMRSYAESNRFGLDQYQAQGYISNDREQESVSKTLEYAYDDWCIAQFAKLTGDDSTYSRYLQRAQYYKNVFDPQTHYMRGKIQSSWHKPFDPKEINNFFTEGNSWQYSFAVPQDIETLISLHGGRPSFTAKLDELFTTDSKTTGRDQSDVSGLIGQYAHGNEPSHHMAYLFNFAGQPWRTQELVHRICNDFYTNDPEGLIGNEDCGQMSAWYVLSAMGFYPVCPGTGEYVVGTPLFDQMTITLENGNEVIIKAVRKKPADFYVSGITWNGKPSAVSYLRHSDLMKGGVLVFTLSGTPSRQWARDTSAVPHSRISEEGFIPVPYMDVPGNKFKDSISIVLKCVDPGAEIYYAVGNSSNPQSFQTFRAAPITLRSTQHVYAYAQKVGKRSKTVEQVFYKIPSGKSISVLSKVNPMYTGGGPEALIDSLQGSANWRTGDWQSYFDQDFDAVIDLQSVKPVRYLGVHVLQDVSPWIIYPREVIFYSSEDGITFTEVARVQNTKAPVQGPAETLVIGGAVNITTRYIKVKAINGGKLPAWHESAGNGSHLFIDEVIIQ